MQDTLKTLQNAVRNLNLEEGENKTVLPYLKLYSFTSVKIFMPQTDSFYIYMVLDGSVRLHTPSGILDYVGRQYSISQIDTPKGAHIISFSDKNDFLSLSVEFSSNDVISVILDLDGNLAEQISNDKVPRGIMSKSDSEIIGCLCRLLSALNNPVSLDYMGKHIRREIIFHILLGSCGSKFLNSVINLSGAGEIYEINSWIKENYRSPFTVEELAKKLNMSVSSFHKKFKNAVGMGPLQCQKRLRLTEARRLMFEENKNVTEAAMDVGYESMSQFTRDYKKMFGHTPKDDTSDFRRQLEKQANFLQE